MFKYIIHDAIFSPSSSTIFEIKLKGSSLTLGYSQGDLFFQGINMILPASNSPTNTWKSIFLTFEPGADVSIEVVAGSTLLQHTIDLEFPDASIESITVGSQYFGLIQDFQIYTPALEIIGGRIEVPPEADFLPQCLCPPGNEISSNQVECIADGGGQMNRYVSIVQNSYGSFMGD